MEKKLEQFNFFKTIFKYADGGKVEIRQLPSKKRFFVGIDDIPTRDFTQEENVYFAVATRDGGGTKDHIVQIPCLFCDIDFKDIDAKKAGERISKNPFPPTAIVSSGGGYHLYWRLKEPLEKSDIPEVESYLRRLSLYFDVPPEATDASRILRVPGTLNHKEKYGSPQPVTVQELNTTCEYDLTDFDQWLPVEATKNQSKRLQSNGVVKNAPGKNAPGWQNSALRGVAEGSRNRTAAMLTGKYIRQGLSDSEIKTLLSGWNEKNQPPLPENELADVIESIRKTHERKQPEDPLEFPDVMGGTAGRFAGLYAEYLEAPKHFFYMTFLTCLGSVIAKNLTLNSEISPQPRLYVLLLGESSIDRKSTAIDKTNEFFRSAMTEDFSACFGVGSAEGLQKLLKERKNVLLCLDEFKQFANKCKLDGSVLLPCVNTLFESNRYEARTKTSTIELSEAYLSLLAASTIDTYEGVWTRNFTDIGFNNRLWLVIGKGKRKSAFPKAIPQSQKDKLRKELGRVLGHVGNELVLNITDDGNRLFQTWYEHLDHSVHAKRLEGYALRFMELLAVNELRTEIDAEIVEKTLTLCDWQLRVRQLHDPIDADNAIAVMEQKIQQKLRGKGDLTDAALRKWTNADKTGAWVYQTALKNLKSIRVVRTVKDNGKLVHKLDVKNIATATCDFA